MRLVHVFLILAAILILPTVSFAEEGEAQFFSALQDVPLMPGLQEVTEMTVVFDKPEGRIVESAAMLDAVPAAQAEAFYAQTLPQLGWNLQGKNTYIRQGEELLLGFEEGGLMKVMVRPKG
jgi:hypothetical protein